MSNLELLPKAEMSIQGWPWTEEVAAEKYGHRKDWPKITIVIPTFNQGQYIEETIRSILLQNYPALELIVIDGGSTDNTKSLLKKYESWFYYWVSEKDDGQCHAINKGLARATGELFNWLNSDDLLEREALLQIARTFMDHPSVQIVRGRILYFGNNAEYGSNFIREKALDRLIANLPNTVPQASTYIRSALLDDGMVGIYNQKLHFVFDLEWMLRYYVQFGCEKIYEEDRIFSRYRLHDESKTVSKNDRFLKETKSIYRELYHKSSSTKAIGTLLDAYCENRVSMMPFRNNHAMEVMRSAHLFLLFLVELGYMDFDVELNVVKLIPHINKQFLSADEKTKLLKIKLLISVISPKGLSSLRRLKSKMLGKIR